MTMNSRMRGVRIDAGTRRIEVQSPTRGTFRTRRIRFPMNKLAMIAHANSDSSANSVGPGVSPC
jgi:hypothetical protein